MDIELEVIRDQDNCGLVEDKSNQEQGLTDLENGSFRNLFQLHNDEGFNSEPNATVGKQDANNFTLAEIALEVNNCLSEEGKVSQINCEIPSKTTPKKRVNFSNKNYINNMEYLIDNTNFSREANNKNNNFEGKNPQNIPEIKMEFTDKQTNKGNTETTDNVRIITKKNGKVQSHLNIKATDFLVKPSPEFQFNNEISITLDPVDKANYINSEELVPHIPFSRLTENKATNLPSKGHLKINSDINKQTQNNKFNAYKLQKITERFADYMTEKENVTGI